MMNAAEFVKLCRSKRAAALMTPEAMQAAQGAMPPPPPMDPAMAGAPMPPPPAGAPMPPPPMDPAMAGAPMPPPPPAAGNAPAVDPAAMQQMFIEFAASKGIMLDPASGTAVGPDGQPLPPQVMQQLLAQFEQIIMAQGAMPPPPPPAGAPMPPPPPMDPAMAGAPMPDAAAGATPPLPEATPMDIPGMLQDIRNNIQSMVKAQLSAQDKKIAAMMDKLDSMKSLLQQIVGTQDQRSTQDQVKQEDLDAMLQQDIRQRSAATQAAVPPTPAIEQLQPKQAAQKKSSLTLLQAMRGIR